MVNAVSKWFDSICEFLWEFYMFYYSEHIKTQKQLYQERVEEEARFNLAEQKFREDVITKMKEIAGS